MVMACLTDNTYVSALSAAWVIFDVELHFQNAIDIKGDHPLHYLKK